MTNTIEKSDDTKLESQDKEIKTTSEPDEIKESSEINQKNISPDANEQTEIQTDKAQKTDDIQTDESEILSTGTRLRQLREQNNISIKHVADRLFLDTRVIEKLEDDDYEHLPPLIFIRGYIRNYAKLLDIKPESVLDTFDPDGQQPKLRPPMKRKEQASRHDLLPTIGTIAVIIVLLVLAAMWKYPDPSPIIPTIPESGPSIPIEPDSSNFDLAEPINNGSIDNPDNVNAEVEDNIEPVVETTPPVNDKTIKVHFKANAWVRITDNTNASLFSETGKKGKVLSFDGTPPFKLKVGNVDGIDVEYRGEIKDIKEYPKRRGQKNLFIIGN